MSALIDATERVLNWWGQNPLDGYTSVDVLEPGLTFEDIEETVANLPCRLPKEVYELYQWRNGTCYGEEEFAGFFGGYTFLPLESALEAYDELIDRSEELEAKFGTTIWRSNWFPLFSFDSEDYFVVLCQTEEISPISRIHLEGFDGETEILFLSLTKMMLTIAECYENGVFSENNDLPTNEKIDQKESIRRKYNPGTVEQWDSW